MRKVKTSWVGAVLTALFFLLSSVASTAFSPGEPMVLQPHPVLLVVEESEPRVRFSVEVAKDPDQHAAGLMFRQEMADERGMLFVFPAPREGNFWMKNTILPLDIIFIRSDGTVDSVRRGVPQSLEPVRSDGLIQFVLELNAGIAEKAGIETGMRLRHPLIKAAGN